ncbi:MULTISPECIES: PepSY domain-containing protein [Microbulbifer]|uniref:PepSY domain-containing protein n=1 Tax=Microbulbifer TaxID=48073 RepID=UPI001CD2EE82|nr:PepSY domain-containing protein [Microbulbifer agarilyticus]MCA0900095.1 PepSY domain-containing protein [Microbulbifer agarilyticus]
MKAAAFIRKLHKWVFLLISVQALLWALSGFYMVVVDLDFIHGDHLVKNQREPLPAVTPVAAESVLAGFGRVDSVSLRAIQGRPYYLVRADGSSYRFDAGTGTPVAELDAQAAKALARYYYNGDALPRRTQLITENPPQEIPARILPVWRVDFADRYGTSLYIDPVSAQLVTRRHDYWRLFDFLWMLHIMDYEAREDVHNNLLRFVALLTFAGTATGFALLYFRFRPRRPRRKLQEVGA